MVQLTFELIEALANEEIIAADIEPEAPNRVKLTTESGYVIIADILQVLSAAERIDEIDMMATKIANERSILETTPTAVVELTEPPIKSEEPENPDEDIPE